MFKYLACAVVAAMSVASANAAIVNLSAASTNPNAGNNSPGYAYNPVVLSLTAGTYTVGVVGTSTAGALYDAYSVYTPSATNGAYTNGNWSFSGAGLTTFTMAATPRFNTAAASLAYYSALAPQTFTLTSTTQVSFYVDDTAMPYFGDDSGGVSLSVNRSAVPEPASWAMMVGGFGLIGGAMRRQRTAVRFA